ncbi:unnamed protein product [Ectocarpus sp. CCAP 1310/34]|nr:unnamed protein product [Ectocarpus sp. CCAP 1310/34]
MTGLFMDDSASEPEDGYAAVGETIKYTLAITNNGHAVLNDVTVRDASLVSGGQSTLVCTEAYVVEGDGVVLASSLALDAEVTCTGFHAVTAADVDNLERHSSASVTAVDVYMTEIQDERTVTVGLDQVGSVQLRLESTYANKGKNATTADEVKYVYTIENNGLLTLYNIAVHAEGLVDIVCVNTDGDSVSGSSPGRVEDLAGYPSDGLAPAGSLTCSATGSVSQAEINAGAKKDTVTAFAYHEDTADHLDSDAIKSEPATSTINLNQVADIDMVSRLTYVAIDLDTALAGVGESIDFEVTMTNGGNVDIDNTVVSNELFKNDAGGYNLDCGGDIPSPWLVDTSFTCTAMYTLSQADIDVGSVSSTTSLRGEPASGGFIANSSTVTETLHRTGLLSATAACTMPDAGDIGHSAGDHIAYTIDLSNTGSKVRDT